MAIKLYFRWGSFQETASNLLLNGDFQEKVPASLCTRNAFTSPEHFFSILKTQMAVPHQAASLSLPARKCTSVVNLAYTLEPPGGLKKYQWLCKVLEMLVCLLCSPVLAFLRVPRHGRAGALSLSLHVQPHLAALQEYSSVRFTLYSCPLYLWGYVPHTAK